MQVGSGEMDYYKTYCKSTGKEYVFEASDSRAATPTADIDTDACCRADVEPLGYSV